MRTIKLFLVVLFSFLFIKSVSSQPAINNLHLIKNFNVRPNQTPTDLNSKYSAIWGWTSPQGREYAILCCVTGTSFLDITDTNNIYECDFVENYLTVNRECKTYLSYAYITSDFYGIAFSGLQIIDMRYLPDSVHLVKTWSQGPFKYSHTISQESHYLYLNGSDFNSTKGITILDILDPENPVKRGSYNRGYVHDSYVRNDTIYAALTFLNKFVVLNAQNKDSITEIAEFNNVPGYSLPHSTWLSNDGNFLFTADESRNNQPGISAIWNIQDKHNVQFVTTFRPAGDNTSVAHNVFVKNKILYISHHTAGLRLLDIRNPYAPVEFAYHDTYPVSNENRLAGNWGCYPFFASGKIISSDMQTGLYVHKIIHDPTSINNISSEIPSGFKLNQNYPNPFNPATKISFQIPKSDFVSLKIYDITGKEILNLVNQQLLAGTYEVDFNASHLASGVYYYKLTSGNFSEVKKMMMVK